MKNFNEILSRLPDSICKELSQLQKPVIDELEEIRLRCGQNITLHYGSKEKTLLKVITKVELQQTLNSLIKFSYYAYEEDLAKGFVTISGGHRVGICGKAVISNNMPILIREISSMNIRFAKEIIGCANPLIPRLIVNNMPVSTLIVSPPGCGKTTLLRDIARILSERGIKVAICDERSEIAGMYNSQPSFNIGCRTDILDGCDKYHGIPMLIRSMSPNVVITDEIGKKSDIEIIEQCRSTGVSIITSIHGYSIKDLENSKIEPLIKSKVFKNIVFLSNDNGPGTIKEIISA